MDASDYIAAASLVVAVFALVYAAKSADQARRANALNLVQEKLKIYDDFCAVRAEHERDGEGVGLLLAIKMGPIRSRARLIYSEEIYSSLARYEKDLTAMVEDFSNVSVDGTASYLKPRQFSEEIKKDGSKIEEMLVTDLQKATREDSRTSTLFRL